MIIALAGFLFSKAKKSTIVEQRLLSNLLLFFIFPCVMISALNIEYNRAKFLRLSCIAVLYLIAQFIFVIITIIFLHPKTPISKQRISSDKMAIVFSNVGFMGIPLINAMYGSEGVFLIVGCNLMYNVFLWTYGIYSVTHKINIKDLFKNPSIISVIVAVVIFLSPFTLPPLVAQSINAVAQMNTALTMILLGMLFANFSLHGDDASDNTNNSIKLYDIIHIAQINILRLIVSPCVLLLVVVLCKPFLHFIPDLRQVLIVLLVAAACPIGMNVANFAVLYNPKNKSYSSLLVLVSSTLCVATIPIIVKFAEEIL